ncbi:MAG: transcriptional repressor LexA [Bacillota bacterium]|jgi:repressor LexA|nr:transcriptional repressor LexA [Eubacteriales bacterium]MDI9492184.1 transcriptional repressor LexA [Bacillota bacterium]NLV70393.1 transcriptional repressor LexA [Clostridiales bacterium]HRV32813.1 transcriptional repressor LexA [Anaerovoracaceae bacterium]MDD3537388.1 transcriptional repressor LexA [Eubacteriales bacterium]
MTQLSTREKKILDYMRAEIKKKGYPPTVREVCAALGIRSTSTVHKALASLEEQGFIRKDPSKRRAVEILSCEGEDTPARKSTGPGRDSDPAERSDIVEIPVVGRIAAGSPILAEEDIEESIPVPSRFLGKGTHFMLTVKGESMIEAGIFDGDYLLVHMQNTAENGDIVVAMIDGFESEATVKTFYKEKDHVRLQPENRSMNPILVKEVKVLGLVKGVFRYLS